MAAPALTFFFPYHEVSGCPVLFSMLARRLAATGRGPIRVVDYADGYMARVLRGVEGVELQRFGQDGAIAERSWPELGAPLEPAYHLSPSDAPRGFSGGVVHSFESGWATAGEDPADLIFGATPTDSPASPARGGT